MKKTICALVASLAIGLTGCGTSFGTNTQPKYQLIKGTPISVDGEYGHGGGSFSTIVEVEGKKTLCYWTGFDTLISSNSVALIQSEINDGDDEQIELTGQYNDNKFEIKSVTANGYKIDF